MAKIEVIYRNAIKRKIMTETIHAKFDKATLIWFSQRFAGLTAKSRFSFKQPNYNRKSCTDK